MYQWVSSNLLLEKMIFHKSHICDLCGLREIIFWIVSMSFFKSPAWANDFPQESHLWSLWPSWNNILNCINEFLQISCLRKWFTTRFTFVIFALSHKLHLWSFLPLWTAFSMIELSNWNEKPAKIREISHFYECEILTWIKMI